MELPEYNGWENKFTWLVHLHLSNEQALMEAVMAFVASVSHRRQVGRLLATWVKVMLFNCLCAHPERDKRFDVPMRLLAWDLAGTALAFVEWDALVLLLTGQGKRVKNRFTTMLSQFILSDGQLSAFLQEMLRAFPNSYQCADYMQEWFREQVDTLFSEQGELHHLAVLTALVNELVEQTYTVIAWQHVARAFRLGY